MDLDDAIRRRRMCRSFLDRPVSPDVVDRLVDRARRAPSAGHTQGWAWLAFEGAEQTAGFWRFAAGAAWLAAPTWPGLLRAPVVLVPLASRQAYLERYAEADKAATGRAVVEGWPQPYWLLDTAMAVQLLLLGVVAEGLGAAWFALHGDPEALLQAHGVPPGWEAIGAVAVGWPAPDDRPASSAGRGRRSVGEILHRGRWVDAGTRGREAGAGRECRPRE